MNSIDAIIDAIIHVVYFVVGYLLGAYHIESRKADR